MATKPSLGRGLGALIRDGVSPSRPPEPLGLQSLPVEKIRPNTFQPRRRFEPGALRELCESIREQGILQPLLVRRHADGYELIAGERRLRAAGLAGLLHVPAIVMEAPDETALELALIENLQREDLNPLEEADGYQLLIDRFTLTHDSVAKQVGKSRSTITNALRLRGLPESVRALLADGRLGAGHAKALTALEIPEEQRLLAERVAAEQLSVRETERLVRKALHPPRKPRAVRSDLPEAHAAHVREQLQQHFGTPVRLRPSQTYANGKRSRGCLEIEFYSNDDLDRIMELLGVRLS